MEQEKPQKTILLPLWNILNFVLPVPVLITSGLFESWSFFTFIVGEDGIIRPERKFLDDILMFPLYITSIGILVSCIAAIIISIKKEKSRNVIAYISFSVAGFILEILLWVGMTYIGSIG